MSRSWVEIDGRALRHNLEVLRGLVPPATKVLAVVKANAYGHGLAATSRELEALGVSWFGVANVVEGATLREAGVRAPILLLSATLPDEMPVAVRHDLALTLSSIGEAKALSRAARGQEKIIEAHFKIDTGMGRLGTWHLEAREELVRIQRIQGIKITGLCTHFASADEDVRFTREQWKAIRPFFDLHREMLCHASNSPAVARGYGFHADMIRTGLALYGVAPRPGDDHLGLRSALTWKTRVCLLRELGPGRTVSYGATYRLRRRERHAVVAMGYGDGYFRAQGGGGCMLVNGVRCPIRGRVTMDEIIIDVTRAGNVKVGDEVIALGAQGREKITARELARQAGTIPWEILTNIGSRVPRVYHHFTSS